MIFIDTNYFLRFLLKDNKEQSEKAKQIFLKASQGEVELITSVLVFFEISWVLSSVYGKDRVSLSEKLLETLNLNVVFDNKDLLFSTLRFFKKSNLSLVDCYNIIFAKEKNVEEFKTFDIQLAKKFSTL